jgi:hypothetical protein
VDVDLNVILPPVDGEVGVYVKEADGLVGSSSSAAASRTIAPLQTTRPRNKTTARGKVRERAARANGEKLLRSTD